MNEKKKPIKKSTIERWMELGIPCYYARFQGPVAPGENKEPVSEFRIKGSNDKYLVDSIVYTPHGLIWKFGSETDITPLANVQWTRMIP